MMLLYLMLLWLLLAIGVAMLLGRQLRQSSDDADE